jgi:hypothetical protein
MHKDYDLDDLLISPIVLFPVFHFGHWLDSAPWDVIASKFDALSVSIEEAARASLHAAVNWRPSPSLLFAMLLWVVAVGASIALRLRRVCDRSNKDWSGL